DRIERGDDGAKLPGGDLGDEKLWTVWQQECHSIAARNADLGERHCKRVALCPELGVCQGAVFEEQRTPPRTLARQIGDVVEKRPVWIGCERRGYTAIVVSQPG